MGMEELDHSENTDTKNTGKVSVALWDTFGWDLALHK